MSSGWLRHGKIIHSPKKFQFEVIDLEDGELLGTLDEIEYVLLPDNLKRRRVMAFLDVLWMNRIVIDVDETGITRRN